MSTPPDDRPPKIPPTGEVLPPPPAETAPPAPVEPPPGPPTEPDQPEAT